LHPNAVSSSFSGIGQVMPITAARRMYSPTAVRPIPTDLTITRSLAPTGVLQAQNFSNLPHRQSLGRHQTSFCESQKKDLARLKLPTTFPVLPYQQGGRLRSD